MHIEKLLHWHVQDDQNKQYKRNENQVAILFWCVRSGCCFQLDVVMPEWLWKESQRKGSKKWWGGEYADQMRIGNIQKQLKNKKINKQCGDICQSAF